MRSQKNIKKSLFPLFLTIALFGTAFSTADFDAEPRTIEITGTDHMKYDVTSIDAEAGEEIRIVLTTESSLPKQAMSHNVVVMSLDAKVQDFVTASMTAKDSQYIAEGFEDQIIAATDLAGGSETVEVTFTVPEEPGSYEFICTFPGHYAAGMKGVLNVQ